MNEEEKKAIEYFKNKEISFEFEIDGDMEKLKSALGITEDDDFDKQVLRVKTLLNLIEKQQKEIELKDKVIDEMVERINVYNFNCEPDCFIENVECEKQTNCNECIKQYFINKVKENKE